MTDYTPTGKPLQNTRGISKQVRDEFELIGIAVNSKANIASPALTGIPTAPTAAFGSSGAQLATLDFVVAAILGVSVTIPGQTGNANKFLKTDGTNASWQYPLPTQTGNANKSLMTDGASETGEFWGEPSFIIRNNQTGAYTALLTDKSDLIDWSGSSDDTLSFTACATLGNGWFCFVRNSGTADLTLDPNSAETIDGLATFKMYPGESRLIQCDGSVLRSIVLSPFYKVFTASDTFTKPPGYSFFEAFLWSAGGGGARNTGTSVASGGGGGGCMPLKIPSSSVGATETITIGAGGAGRTGSTGNGSDGGNTSFGSIMTVTGGTGGTVSAAGAGGLISALSPSAGTKEGFGAPAGGAGAGASAAYGGAAGGGSSTAGGNSVYGGGGGGGAAASAAAGGTSVMAGAGGDASITATASNGSAPSGGGGGGSNNNNGGDGARGELRIWGLI